MKKIISKYNKKQIATFAVTMLMAILCMMPMQKAYSQNNKAKAQNISNTTSQNQNSNEPKSCGYTTIDTAAIKMAMDYEAANAKSLLPISYTVRVFFHILRYDNGSNPAVTEADIQSEFNSLVDDYADNNMCFINCGLDYISNTNLDTNFDADADPSSLFDPYRIPNCINIFYTEKIKGSNPACGGNCTYGGFTFSIPGTFCLVRADKVGNQTISHELGHCFGLLHTFENYNQTSYENINGSNSSSAADKVTDTPADPYAYKTDTCFSTSGSGLYNGNCTDPNGQSNFTPPYDNNMSYWYNSGLPQLFTAGQYTRSNSIINTSSGLQDRISSPSVTLNSSNSMSGGYLITSSTAPMTTTGNVIFTASSRVILGGQTVILSPGFYSFPNATGYLLIRTPVCVPASPRISSVINTETIADENSNNIKCYPNPFSNEMTVEFSLAKDDNVYVTLYDLMGKKIKTISQSFYSKGKHDLSFDASDVQAGIYLAVLQCSEYRKEQKVIKVN